MPHNLHRAGCPCALCERPPHPSEYRMGLRGVANAIPLSLLLWAALLVFGRAVFTHLSI
jgi:hypothetical protein